MSVLVRFLRLGPIRSGKVRICQVMWGFFGLVEVSSDYVSLCRAFSC
jgi:hypothetical protein